MGVTVDEPTHLLSARLYWQGQDDLRPRDLAPGIKILGGWVPALLGLPVPRDHEAWRRRDGWLLAVVMMERLGARQIRRFFFFARVTLIVFPVLTAWLLWRWGRKLFGEQVGLLLAAIFVLEPTALAHGALFKNDLAATFGYLFFWYRAWKYYRQPNAKNVVTLALACLAAVFSKYSALVLIPALIATVVLRNLRVSPPRFRPMVIQLGLVLGVMYLGLAVAAQFELRRLTSQDLAQANLPAALAAVAKPFLWVPVPVPLWEGAASLWQSNRSNPWVYWFGQQRPGGHPLYFAGALLLKAPVALQLLLVIHLGLTGYRLRSRGALSPTCLWLLPAIFWVAMASASSLQLGVRLVLPALPLALLACGTTLQWLLQGRRQAVLLLLLGGLAAESISVFPRGISFFNVWAGGPGNGLRYLADSNLDWGQDLRELRKRFDQLRLEKLHLSYFGTDNPWAYFTDRELELVAPPWNDELAGGRDEFRPAPGQYYAVSASLLPGHMFEPKYHHFYRVFRDLKPVTKAGYSIFIYRVPE